MKNIVRSLSVLTAFLLITLFVVSCSNEQSINSIIKPHSGARDGAGTNGTPPDPDARPHRGRIQMQGNDINVSPEPSWSWAYDYPVTKQEALTRLDVLYNNLTTRQKEDRSQAYQKAKTFISNAPTSGYSSVIRRTFQNSPVRDNTIRIDIEILAGDAFTNWWHIGLRCT